MIKVFNGIKTLYYVFFAKSGFIYDVHLKILNSIAQILTGICDICTLNELPFYDTDTSDKLHTVAHIDTSENSIIDNCDINTDSTRSEDTFSALQNFTGFIIAHLNVCSLYKNIEEIRCIMTENDIPLLTLCETRLDESITNAEITVQGYHAVRRDRNRQGGGLIFYIHKSINFTERKDLNVSDNTLELLFLQIELPNQKPFIIVSWYRNVMFFM